MTTTQNCAECGTRAEPGLSFCDACGAVLSWADRAGAAVTAEPGWDAFSRPGGGTGLPRRSQDSPGGESRDDDVPTVNPPATASPSERDVEGTASTESDTLEIETSSGGEGMTDRARRLIVPVAESDPVATPFVAPVLPGRPVAQRPQAIRAPGEELGVDGGTPCPWCGTRNRPDRHYCARCAMPMAGEEHAPGRLPWWRRLLNFRNRQTPWAGDRPRLRRAFDRVLSWLGAAIVLTLVIVLAVNIPKGVQATRDHFARRASVAPIHVSASRSYPGHKPDLAFDRLNNTWWGPGVSGSGQGQWIEATFDEPTRLLDLIITPGVSVRADQNSQSALPHRIGATVTMASGKTVTRELILDGGAGGQVRSFTFGDVIKVRFTLESAYQPSTTKQVAIAEIEFFGPSNAGGS